MSGWEKNMSHNDQTAKFTSSFNKNHIVKSFRYTETKLIRDFLNEKKDKVKAIILYSAAYTLVNKLNFPICQNICKQIRKSGPILPRPTFRSYRSKRLSLSIKNQLL